ncbi:MAG: ROK family transcriptional regulator [Actinobacteria bacterium]|nr:ROK family transcriptional regulator [Actinomycetota bacterium]
MLAMIREGRGSTRAELGEATGLARSTVAQRIDALLRHGYLRAEEVAGSSGGRPPTVLSLNPRFGSVLVADFGVTRAHLAVCDLEAAVLAEQTHAIGIERGPDEILAWLEERFAELREEVGAAAGPALAAGVGIPASVDMAAGRPVSPSLAPGWHDHPVVERLIAALGIPVLLDNDVNVMALGEHRLNWTATDDLVFVKVATGIGAGIIAGGRVYHGASGAAGELGHVRAPGADDVVCSCGQRGCLEAIAAGPALARKLGVDGARGVAESIRAGDRRAIALARDAGREIGEVLATIVTFLNPRAIVIGGEMADASEDLIAGIREAVFSRSVPLATRGLEIVHSSAGNQAGPVGAAVMAIDHALDPRAVDRRLSQASRSAPRG